MVCWSAFSSTDGNYMTLENSTKGLHCGVEDFTELWSQSLLEWNAFLLLTSCEIIGVMFDFAKP